MSTSNNWLNPYQRSFNDIKAKLISELRLDEIKLIRKTGLSIFLIAKADSEGMLGELLMI